MLLLQFKAPLFTRMYVCILKFTAVRFLVDTIMVLAHRHPTMRNLTYETLCEFKLWTRAAWPGENHVRWWKFGGEIVDEAQACMGNCDKARIGSAACGMQADATRVLVFFHLKVLLSNNATYVGKPEPEPKTKARDHSNFKHVHQSANQAYQGNCQNSSCSKHTLKIELLRPAFILFYCIYFFCARWSIPSYSAGLLQGFRSSETGYWIFFTLNSS